VGFASLQSAMPCTVTLEQTHICPPWPRSLQVNLNHLPMSIALIPGPRFLSIGLSRKASKWAFWTGSFLSRMQNNDLCQACRFDTKCRGRMTIFVIRVLQDDGLREPKTI
jgi:hypothetical protein